MEVKQLYLFQILVIIQSKINIIKNTFPIAYLNAVYYLSLIILRKF